VAVETAAPEQQAYQARPASGSRKWLAFGTGVGIEVSGADLLVAVARVRPGGVTATGFHRITGFAQRAATEWGNEFAAFTARSGARNVPVWVLLPRQEVIVRHLMLPGVADKDLESAVGYQVDALHPHEEDAAVFSYARLGDSHAVMVGIARREVVDQYANLFSEAGITMAGFSFSAAVLYSASRILVSPPDTVLALNHGEGAVEAYGHSPARPVFSGLFELPADRVIRVATAELRAESEPPVAAFDELLPPFRAPESYPRREGALPLAAAISGAVPRLALAANLLPVERRTQTSRAVYVPTLILTALLALAGFVLVNLDGYQKRQLTRRLQQEIRLLEKQAAETGTLDQAVQSAREKMALLDRYRQRSQSDMDALKDITTIIAPPAWLRALTLSRTEAVLHGEGENVTPFLKVFDESARFSNSAFAQALSRIGQGNIEVFTIRTSREGQGVGVEAGEQR